jgi:hypothetical protein
MKLLYFMTSILVIAGCGNDGSKSKSANIPTVNPNDTTTAQTTSIAQSSSQICQWLFSEGLILNRFEPNVNFYFFRSNDGLAPGNMQNRGRQINQNSNDIVFNGNCTENQSEMMLYVRGNNFSSAYRSSNAQNYSYSVSFKSSQLTETFNLNSKVFSADSGQVQKNLSRFTRSLVANGFTLSLAPGSLQLTMTGPGEVNRNLAYPAPQTLSFTSTIVLSTRPRTWQIVGQVPNEVYGLILNIR